MKNIISAVVVVVCILAGSFVGNMLKAGGSTAEGDTHAKDEKHADAGHKSDEKGGHGSDKKDKKDKHGDKKKKKEKKDKHGDGHGKSDGYGGGGSDVAYFSFSREFIVPIMRDNRVDSLVILNLNLEVDPDYSEKMFTLEPKLRDNIMTTLVSLSNDGKTLDSPTNTESYETIRSVVLMNLQSVVSTGVENVLILDMAKQDL